MLLIRMHTGPRYDSNLGHRTLFVPFFGGVDAKDITYLTEKSVLLDSDMLLVKPDYQVRNAKPQKEKKKKLNFSKETDLSMKLGENLNFKIKNLKN